MNNIYMTICYGVYHSLVYLFLFIDFYQFLKLKKMYKKLVILLLVIIWIINTTLANYEYNETISTSVENWDNWFDMWWIYRRWWDVSWPELAHYIKDYNDNLISMLEYVPLGNPIKINISYIWNKGIVRRLISIKSDDNLYILYLSWQNILYDNYITVNNANDLYVWYNQHNIVYTLNATSDVWYIIDIYNDEVIQTNDLQNQMTNLWIDFLYSIWWEINVTQSSEIQNNQITYSYFLKNNNNSENIVFFSRNWHILYQTKLANDYEVLREVLQETWSKINLWEPRYYSGYYYYSFSSNYLWNKTYKVDGQYYWYNNKLNYYEDKYIDNIFIEHNEFDTFFYTPITDYIYNSRRNFDQSYWQKWLYYDKYIYNWPEGITFGDIDIIYDTTEEPEWTIDSIYNVFVQIWEIIVDATTTPYDNYESLKEMINNLWEQEYVCNIDTGNNDIVVSMSNVHSDWIKYIKTILYILASIWWIYFLFIKI